EPVSGELACGEVGAGRLAEPSDIVQAVLPILTEQTLRGQTWVINAGPTLEAWDAVRVLTNRATGALGAKLADVASVQSAQVVLIAGKGTPQTREDVQRITVESAAEMMQACLQYAADSDVFVGTAAVSDYRFTEINAGKLKREGSGSLQVTLTENPDIVQAIANMSKRPRKVIAFAAESENHIDFAQGKLQRKGVDAIVANDVANMGSNSASGWYITANAVVELEAQDKQSFAATLAQHITT
ncbi:MAG: phosphopantothenoylcysteine decarboxylase, partial [Ghiorsea sp.]|nr:phosphopantothenoylcysteine decarboxylase [Ghiorsea sp.]